jgi:phosphoadenosine phosphosulfate reductase
MSGADVQAAPVLEAPPPRWARDADALNHQAATESVEAVLRLAVATFGEGRLALVSAFGPGSLVLIHLLARIAPQLPVIFIDTLHHFPETLELADRVRSRYGVDLRIQRPAADRAAFEAIHGPRLWERDLAAYHRVTRIEPFRRATAGLDAWITGRRREQADTRAALPVFEPGAQVRVNPLAGWTGEAVWRFIRERGVPYNALHDRGYRSIGDAPLTTPVTPGEHERAGRWRGLGITECGIHGT